MAVYYQLNTAPPPQPTKIMQIKKKAKDRI